MGTRSAHGDKAYRAILAGSIAACVALSGTSLVLTHQVMDRMDTVAATARTRADKERAARDDDASDTTATGDANDTTDAAGDEKSPSATDAASSAMTDAAGGATADAATTGDAPTSQATSPADVEGKNEKTPSTQPDAKASGDDMANVAAGGGERVPHQQAQQAQPTRQAQPDDAAARPTRQPNVWHVSYGNTLAYISDATGVSVDAIANANQIRDVNRIYADSALVIPD